MKQQVMVVSDGDRADSRGAYEEFQGGARRPVRFTMTFPAVRRQKESRSYTWFSYRNARSVF